MNEQTPTSPVAVSTDVATSESTYTYHPNSLSHLTRRSDVDEREYALSRTLSLVSFVPLCVAVRVRSTLVPVCWVGSAAPPYVGPANVMYALGGGTRMHLRVNTLSNVAAYDAPGQQWKLASSTSTTKLAFPIDTKKQNVVRFCPKICMEKNGSPAALKANRGESGQNVPQRGGAGLPDQRPSLVPACGPPVATPAPVKIRAPEGRHALTGPLPCAYTGACMTAPYRGGN